MATLDCKSKTKFLNMPESWDMMFMPIAQSYNLNLALVNLPFSNNFRVWLDIEYSDFEGSRSDCYLVPASDLRQLISEINRVCERKKSDYVTSAKRKLRAIYYPI